MPRKSASNPFAAYAWLAEAGWVFMAHSAQLRADPAKASTRLAALGAEKQQAVARTPYSRTVVAELREVPWARWDPVLKAWRVPFRSFEDLRRHWPHIEDAARRAEPEARRQRKKERGATSDAEDKRASSAERRRQRYPVPGDALPPLDRVLMTHTGCVVFTTVTGELVEPGIGARFYPDVAIPADTLVWADWRRPSHAELVQAWPARTPPCTTDLARGWWQPTIDELRPERRKMASLERARETRKAKVTASNSSGC